MRECRQCGFPRKFASYFDWREDGTILSTARSGTRVQISLLNAGELESVFSDLSHTIGLNVEYFLIKAYKDIGKAIYSKTPIRHVARLPNNSFFRPQFLARAVIRLASPQLAGLGTGRVSIDRFKAGEMAVVRFAYPCLNPMLTGSTAAIYESMEGISDSVAECEVEAGDLLVRLRHADEQSRAPAVEDRLHYDDAVPIQGPVRYSRCRGCGAPVLAGLTLRWDTDHGVILNRLTGDREVVVAVQAINAILRELEIELGESIPGIIYGHQKSLSHRLLERVRVNDTDRFFDEYLTELSLRGMGYPLVFDRSASTVRVEIVNAYNQVLYAAKIAAAMEVSCGAPSEITWEKREGKLGAYTISTAVSADR